MQPKDCSRAPRAQAWVPINETETVLLGTKVIPNRGRQRPLHQVACRLALIAQKVQLCPPGDHSEPLRAATLPPTQGMPFCLVGSDQLALFRCISCRYLFDTDATRSPALDALARVFVSSQVCPP